MKLYAIETGNVMFDGGAVFGVVPKTIWQAKYPANDLNLVNFSMRCLLIHEGERILLVDCGMGNTMPESLLKYYFVNGSNTLLNSLAAQGYSPNDITDVIFTHLHFDHCGGAITKNADESLQETFPNAQYWVGKSHWKSVQHPNRRERPSLLKDNIEPLRTSGKLNFVEHSIHITPNVELRLFNGHTAGQIMPIVHYKNHLIAYTADVFPTSVHLPASYVCGYDIEPLITMQECDEFLNEAVEKSMILFFEHDVNVECCTLTRSEKGVVIDTTFPLSSL
ncbi:MAG: MBL fold metallo-hydrolase [Bacteroidales bacterium]|jgi:glyoxylase-like metal-dependent hydrolase (beta-lactamase superfamily II)|nr:MBL fold metallo-hydrolase [Bacteroidales bacterium]